MASMSKLLTAAMWVAIAGGRVSDGLVTAGSFR
jgi:hypothetical protein